MDGDAGGIDHIGCGFIVLPARFLYPSVAGGAEVAGGAAGSNRRRGDWGRGGMAVVDELVGGRGIGTALAGVECKECVISDDENHVLPVRCACE